MHTFSKTSLSLLFVFLISFINCFATVIPTVADITLPASGKTVEIPSQPKHKITVSRKFIQYENNMQVDTYKLIIDFVSSKRRLMGTKGRLFRWLTSRDVGSEIYSFNMVIKKIFLSRHSGDFHISIDIYISGKRGFVSALQYKYNSWCTINAEGKSHDVKRPFDLWDDKLGVAAAYLNIEISPFKDEPAFVRGKRDDLQIVLMFLTDNVPDIKAYQSVLLSTISEIFANTI